MGWRLISILKLVCRGGFSIRKLVEHGRVTEMGWRLISIIKLVCRGGFSIRRLVEHGRVIAACSLGA